jgi:hypothetical protein
MNIFLSDLGGVTFRRLHGSNVMLVPGTRTRWCVLVRCLLVPAMRYSCVSASQARGARFIRSRFDAVHPWQLLYL